MAANFKARSLAADIASELADRLTLDVTEGTAADGFPQIVVGTGVASAAGCYIKIRTETWPDALTSIGTAATVYGPQLIQVVFEANFAGTTDNVADTTLFADVAQILGCLFIRGCKVEVYQSAYATAPVAAEITAANLKTTFEPLPTKGMISNQ